MDKEHSPEEGLHQYSFFELAFIGWGAGMLILLAVIFILPFTSPGYFLEYQTYSGYLLDPGHLILWGIMLLVASPGAITGGLVGGRLGQGSQIMGAAIGGALGAFLLGCVCIALSLGQ